MKLIWKAEHEAEYEICKDIIDYKNKQLEELTKFIENQPIWKYKFSTDSHLQYNRYLDFRFKGDGSESKEYDEENSFAGQSKDSIYYISQSGVSLRLKKSLLFQHGVKDMLQKPQDLIIFRDWELEAEDMKSDLEGANKIVSFPTKAVSFEPKIGYYVEEFYTKGIDSQKNDDRVSKICINNEGEKILVKNFDDMHAGHQVNKIYFSRL